MMKSNKHTFLLSCLLLSFLLSGRAQAQVSEDDIKLQELLVDANREKLIGNYDNAIALLKEILKKDARNDAVSYELARIYEAVGDDEKAVKAIQDAVEWAPGNPWYFKFQASLFQKMNRNREAAEAFRQVTRLEPEDPYNYYRWAYFLVLANDISGALKVYDELEKKTGLNEEIIRRKHALYVGIGDNKKAARELERLAAAYPSDTEYRLLLAEFYSQSGDQDKAMAAYREILKLDPNHAKAQLALAGKPEQASDEILYLQSLEPVFRNPEADINLKIGKLMPFITKVADTGNRQLADAALALTAIIEQVHPFDAKGFSASGDLLYYSGRRLEALEKYRKTLELDDTVFLVWEQVMHIYQEEKDFDKLLGFSERAMDFFPNQAIAYYFFGLAAHELGKSRDALPVLQEALLVAGNNGPLKMDIQGLLGLVYNSLGQTERSVQAFEAALGLNPQSPEVLSNYAFTLAERNENLEKARQMAGQAAALIPGQPRYLDTYGWVLYRMKRYAEARQQLEKAIESGGASNARTLEHLGDVLYQLNEPEQALEFWKQARERGKGSELLEKKITGRKLYE